MAEMRRTEGHHALAELADRQHGVVSMRQLRGLGYSYDAVANAAGSGRLHRVHRGVYAVGRRRLDWHGCCLAAVLAAAPACASHGSAGWIWGLLRYAPERIDVTAASRRHRRAGMRVHYAPLGRGERVERDGIPVTSVARTQLDLAATLPARRVERMLERAEELSLFDLKELDRSMARATHHRGVRPLREALGIHRPAAVFTRSRLELEFLALTRAAGLPEPAMNHNVVGLELDAYWERERFAVELDVFETHGTRAAFERDRLRQEELLLAGIETTRITGARLGREPEAVMARLETLLQRRREELAAPLRRRRGGGR